MDRTKFFDSLIDSVSCCDLCKEMCNRRKVLSSLNGNINSKVVFIAEAPGRLGAECTGIPLFGDSTGNNFEVLLSNIGWSRDEIFITNAILCNPQDSKGNNATPTNEEICNCSYYLEMILELIQPEVVVTLGSKALYALNNIETHNYELKNVVAELLPWHGIKLFPMYHMSPMATLHRSITQQRADFIALSHEVSPLTGLKKKVGRFSYINKNESAKRSKLASVVDYILYKLGQVSFFKLTKLLYLIDYHYLKQNNQTITNSIYLRMQEGPWIPYLKNIVAENSNVRSMNINGLSILTYTLCDEPVELNYSDKIYINEYLEKYKGKSESTIKTMVYMTEPMKYILNQEKSGRNMLKKPVIYKNQTIEEIDT